MAQKEPLMESSTSPEWRIPSNSGREEIFGSLKSASNDGADRILLFEVKCRRECFSRYASGQLVQDYDLCLHQVAISEAKLRENLSELAAWLDAPTELTLDFSPSKGQILRFSFEARADVISSKDKPVCTMHCGSFLTAIEVGFVVDQSCIRIFHDSLASCLA